MTTIQKILYLCLLFIFINCKDYTYLYRKNVQGTYELICNPTIQITIDVTGSIAGTPETQMIFYQAISETEAIYIKKYDGIKHYVPIRIDNNILYYNDPSLSSHNVSFMNMIAFATKIQ